MRQALANRKNKAVASVKPSGRLRRSDNETYAYRVSTKSGTKQMSANERSGQLLVVVKHIQRKRPQGDIISTGNTQKILHPTLSYR